MIYSHLLKNYNCKSSLPLKIGCALKISYDVTCLNFHRAFATQMLASKALGIFSVNMNIVILV